VQSRISKLKNELQDAESHARQANTSDPAERIFVEIFHDYQRRLRKANAFDFDDLLAQTVYLFRAFPQVADKYRRRFTHILVDEYQDTNHAQYQLIRELTKPVQGESMDLGGGMLAIMPEEEPQGASLTVVGDSDQSIYAFRGADIRNITEFERDFPGAKVVLLEQNYRSSQNILDAANAVIRNNFDRKDKKLWTSEGEGAPVIGFTGYSQHDEAQFIADEIDAVRRKGVDYSEMAVFYRTNSQSRALEEIFIRSAIPYRIMGGTKFYDRAEIKDALAYLMAVVNPADELAVRRILNKPKRGIGAVTETNIARFAADNDISFRDAIGHAAEIGLGPKIRGSLDQLDAVLREAQTILLPEGEDVKPTSVTEGLQVLLNKSGYLDTLRRSRDPQDEARVENLDELVAVTREFARNNPEGTVVDFLTEVALVADSDDLDDQAGTVSLMTLHTAKGLEFDTVFLTGVEEDLIPHRISAGEPGGPQEERRLFYVGITRARKRLYLSLAMTRAQFGEVSAAMPSRFLQEIPAGLIDWRQSPGDVNGRGGTASRALNANRPRDNRWGVKPLEKKAPSAALSEFTNRVTGKVRDNGDLELAAGDRVRHDDFGEGTVDQVTGLGAKRIAHVRFDEVGPKKLLIKVAPIEKL
jgi:DNA helicase-2/ATP-dependent DNA helicase PcrA